MSSLPANSRFDPRSALRAQIRIAGEGLGSRRSAGSSHVDLRLESTAASALAASSLRSVFGAARLDSDSGRGDSWASPAVGARLLTDDTVPGIGEHPSIRIRRCAPRSGSWARVDPSRLV
jgi:hypothetical protein